MTDAVTEAPVSAQERTTEGSRDVLLDLFLEHWRRIATTAWEGFLTHGLGTVLVEDGSRPPSLTYRAGSPCSCHEELVARYEPEHQAVIAVVGDGHVNWIAALGGWPTPPEAFATTPAETLGAIVN